MEHSRVKGLEQTHYIKIKSLLQALNLVRSTNLSLKYQRFTPSGCKEIWIRKFEFVAKNQLLIINVRKNMGERKLLIRFLSPRNFNFLEKEYFAKEKNQKLARFSFVNTNMT